MIQQGLLFRYCSGLLTVRLRKVSFIGFLIINLYMNVHTFLLLGGGGRLRVYGILLGSGLAVISGAGTEAAACSLKP